MGLLKPRLPDMMVGKKPFGKYLKLDERPTHIDANPHTNQHGCVRLPGLFNEKAKEKRENHYKNYGKKNSNQQKIAN